MTREPDVYDFDDARRYLRLLHEHRKATRRGYSYRTFARKAGFSSPNYLKLVIDGKRDLSPPMAHAFGTACGLSGDPLRRFLDLVAYTQARGPAERATLAARLRPEAAPLELVAPAGDGEALAERVRAACAAVAAAHGPARTVRVRVAPDGR